MAEEKITEKKNSLKSKIKMERKVGFWYHFDIAMWCFIVLAAAILFYFLLTNMSYILSGVVVLLHILLPVIVGFGLAYILDPPVMGLENYFMKYIENEQQKRNASEKKLAKYENKKEKKRLRRISKGKDEEPEEADDKNPVLVGGRGVARALSILIVVVGLITCVTLLFMAVIPALIDSIANLADKFPDYMNQVIDTLNHTINKHTWLKKRVPNAEAVFQYYGVDEKFQTLMNDFLEKAADWAIIALKMVYNLAIGLIVAIYLLAGKERFIGQAKKLCFTFFKPKHANDLINSMNLTNRVFKSSILGKILDSIIIGLLCYLAMGICALCGLEAIGDNKILVSIVIGVTNVVPFFGPFFGGIPSCFLIFCINPVEGLIMAVIVLVLQQFDGNYLTPMIVGKSVGLSPFYVLVAILIGGGLFGVVGMLLAVPLGAVIYGFLKTIIESKLTRKKLPVKTNEYAVIPGGTIYKMSQENENAEGNEQTEAAEENIKNEKDEVTEG